MPATTTGFSLAISAIMPATHTAAGFQALTFTEIGYVTGLGPLGVKFDKTETKAWKEGTVTSKASPNYGVLAPTYAYHKADAGQAIMKTVGGSPTGEAAFRVTEADGTIQYFKGPVFGSPVSYGETGSTINVTSEVVLNTPHITV